MIRALLVLWISLAPATTLAQPADAAPTEEARASARVTFEAGNVAYGQGRYREAATAYEEAHRLDPLSAILFSAAQAYRRLFYEDPDPRWLARARELYQEYLSREPTGARREHAMTHLGTIDALLARIDAPATPSEGEGPGRATQLMVSSRTPGARGRVDDGPAATVPVIATVTPGPHRVTVEAPGFFTVEESHVAVEGRLVVAPVELRARPGMLRVRAPEGASIEVDGRSAGTAPVDPLELSAGRHRLVVTANGRVPLDRRVDLRRGEPLDVAVTLDTTAQRRIAWVGFAAAGASLVAAGITGGLAIAAQDRAQALRPPQSNQELLQGNEELATRDDLRTAAVSLLVGGAAVAIGSALLYVLDHRRPGAR